MTCPDAVDIAGRVMVPTWDQRPARSDPLPTSIHHCVYCFPMRHVATAPHGALARFGRALSDPTRARVLMALREGPSYPADLAVAQDVSRQSMSNHLACLRRCGLVVAVPEGRRTRYQLADARLADALGGLIDVVRLTDPRAVAEAAGDGC